MLTPLQKFVFVCFILVIGTWRLAEYLICWQTWDEVPATVEAVSIDEIPGDGGLPDYRVSIRYRFVSAGEAFESGQLDFFGGETFVFSDPGAAEAEALKWRRDPPDTCRVHPRDPRRSAILPLKELDFSIILFAVVLLIALATYWEALVGLLYRGKEVPRPNFLLDVVPAIGWALLLTVPVVSLLVIKLVGESAASGWVERPAVVIDSELAYIDGEWEPRVLYEWVGESGQVHRSRRVTFDSFYGPVTAIERFLESYPAGAAVACFVDPESPEQAVLVRRYWLGSPGLLALSMLILGMWWYVWRRWCAWRSRTEPPGLSPDRLFRLNSPLVIGAGVFLLEAARPMLREWQLGVYFSDVQVMALLAGVVLVTYALVVLSRRALRRGGRWSARSR